MNCRVARSQHTELIQSGKAPVIIRGVENGGVKLEAGSKQTPHPDQHLFFDLFFVPNLSRNWV